MSFLCHPFIIPSPSPHQPPDDREARSKRDEYIERYKDEVLTAERAVLFSLGFELNIEQPHFTLLKIIGKFDQEMTKPGSRDVSVRRPAA